MEFIDWRSLIGHERFENDLLVNEFLAGKKLTGQRCVLGRNEHSRNVLERVDIDAVVDDYAPYGELWCGKPVIRSSQLNSGAIVVNCSMSISPLTARKRMEALRDVAVISYCDLFKAEVVPLPAFSLQARKELDLNEYRYKSVYQALEDDDSRAVFNSLISYWVTADSAYMKSFSVRLSDQYFEDFLGPLTGAVFVDCGGYDGETSKEFASRYPKYRSICLIEPSPANMELAKFRLRDVRNVEYLQVGVSNEFGALKFNSDGGSASSVSEDGDTLISVAPLDALIAGEVSFIKMDLEGWEGHALEGARELIRKHHPILAIAVYHSFSDFWKIPEYVLSLRNDYQIFYATTPKGGPRL